MGGVSIVVAGRRLVSVSKSPQISIARARRKRRFRTTLRGMILGQIDPQHNNFKILNNSGRTQGQIHGRKDHESAETAETSQRHISASYGPMAVILHPRAITLRVLSTVGLSLAIIWWFCRPGGRLKSNVQYSNTNRSRYINRFT